MISTVSARNMAVIDRRLADIGRIDAELAAGYQGLIEQLDYDGLLSDQRALLILGGLASVLTSLEDANATAH